MDNALRLLMLFRERPRVRLSEASEHLGVAHSTAHRLMAMLAYHGFVRQEPGSRAYLAGPAAALAVSGPVSWMTNRAVERIAAELRERAAELERLI